MKQQRKYADAQRPSSSERGYGTRWGKYRAWFLVQPENIMCSCGCGRYSKVVDHIIPVKGPDDPLFWDPKNHAGLAIVCHNRKTMLDRKKGLTKEFTRDEMSD